ncbi:hypothetical protein [Streptomyces sp. PR69]|uniref:hypothetical protein n=1 Tax=Streptomyces sp. PR69 TaxID=2984950 RepID=UPI002264951E|nr:hypothetical protein [Streptomyces sp. PR69]
MKKILEFAGTALLVVGGCGVIRELTGWFPFLGFTRYAVETFGFLDGKELFAYAVYAVVGFGMLMVADRAGRGGGF